MASPFLELYTGIVLRRVCGESMSAIELFNETEVSVTSYCSSPKLIHMLLTRCSHATRKFELPECLRGPLEEDEEDEEEEEEEEGGDDFKVGFVVHLNTHKR